MWVSSARRYRLRKPTRKAAIVLSEDMYLAAKCSRKENESGVKPMASSAGDACTSSVIDVTASLLNRTNAVYSKTWSECKVIDKLLRLRFVVVVVGLSLQ